MIGCGLAFGLSYAASAQPRETEAFNVAYGMSYYGFDGCGDSLNGSILRRAVTERVDHCPFSAAAKTAFHLWAARQNERMADQVQRYVATRGQLPERLDGMKRSCREEMASPEHQQAAALLARYARGDIPVTAVIMGACNQSAGGP